MCDCVYRTVKPVTALFLQDSEACDRIVCDYLQDGEACDGTVCDSVYRTVKPVMAVCV